MKCRGPAKIGPFLPMILKTLRKKMRKFTDQIAMVDAFFKKLATGLPVL